MRVLDAPSDANPDFIERLRKSNRLAIRHLEQREFGGDFNDVARILSAINIQNVRVKSTVNFYASFAREAYKRFKGGAPR